MCYVYDIVLNFNSDYYDFYEWKKDDLLYHIKRINLVRVSSAKYNEIFVNYVEFDNEFLLSIFNKCEYYNSRRVDTLPYVFLLTDSYRVMGLLLDNTGKVIKYSSMLLDEEEDVLDLCNKLGEVSIVYKIVKKRDKNEFITRQENNMIKYIAKDLTIDYQKKNINKLRYLYYEYFNKQSDDIDLIYHELVGELNKSIGKKHYDLYNLIKLSYSSKSV